MANPLVDALMAARQRLMSQKQQPAVDPNAGVDAARPWDSPVLQHPMQGAPVAAPVPLPAATPPAAPVQPGDDAAALLRLIAARNKEIAMKTGNPWQQAQ